MASSRMVKWGLEEMLACCPDHTPEIIMSLCQGLHVLADLIPALITELQAITIQETAEPGRISC